MSKTNLEESMLKSEAINETVQKVLNPKLDEKVRFFSKEDEKSRFRSKDKIRLEEKDKVDVVCFKETFNECGPSLNSREHPLFSSEELVYFCLRHAIKILKHGGRGAFIINANFLILDLKENIKLRRYLFKECEVTSILMLPLDEIDKIYKIVIFFKKGWPTEEFLKFPIEEYGNLQKFENNLLEFAELVSEDYYEKSYALHRKNYIKTCEEIDEKRAKCRLEAHEKYLVNPCEYLEDCLEIECVEMSEESCQKLYEESDIKSVYMDEFDDEFENGYILRGSFIKKHYDKIGYSIDRYENAVSYKIEDKYYYHSS
jgi:hypothetical protein